MKMMSPGSTKPLLLLLMFLARSMVESEILRLPECSKFDGEFSVKVDGRVLAIALLMRLKSLSYFDCLFKCVSHKKCKSINYSEKSKECELISKNSRDKNIAYEERHGWSFYETPHGPVESLGPICRQTSPCKHGICKDTCQDPGYFCTCHWPYIGLDCDIYAPGLRPETAASSCLEIRKLHGETAPPSRMYWIKTSSLVQMYCDMKVDGGGWTKVGNVNRTSNNYVYNASDFQDDLQSLRMSESSYYALSTTGLASLHQFINFTSIRIYCHKPHVGRTIHIVTANNSLGWEIVRYMTGSSKTRPASCNSYLKMPDDDSILSKNCSRWVDQSWGYSAGRRAELLYHVTVSTIDSRAVCISSISGRQDCDDISGPSKAGIWMFFVR